MSLFARLSWRFGLATAAAGALAAMAALAAGPREDPFTAENQAAMSAMMAGMAIRPSGDVDRDFAIMMIPHHRGAIELAEAELRHGRNEQLRRIAEEIIVDQQQEIAAMRLALGEASPTPASNRGNFIEAGSSWAYSLLAHICSRKLR
jgi:predicted outer membrane protein